MDTIRYGTIYIGGRGNNRNYTIPTLSILRELHICFGGRSLKSDTKEAKQIYQSKDRFKDTTPANEPRAGTDSYNGGTSCPVTWFGHTISSSFCKHAFISSQRRLHALTMTMPVNPTLAMTPSTEIRFPLLLHSCKPSISWELAGVT